MSLVSGSPLFLAYLGCSLIILIESLLPTLSPDVGVLLLSEEMCEQYNIPPYMFQCTDCGAIDGPRYCLL